MLLSAFMVKYSTPPKIEMKELGIGEKHNMRIDEEMILELVGNKLYTDPMDGLRELYANSINACKTAREKYGANPYVEFIIDVDNMKLEIIEHDSLGITKEVFEEVYTVLGRSGNFDGTKPGQFGVGMAAYYALSDTMLLESYSRETKKPLIVLGRGLRYFEDITDTNKRTFDWYGTKITMTLRLDMDEDKEKIDEERESLARDLIQTLKEISRFSGVKTILHILGKSRREYAYLTDDKEEIGPVTPEDYLESKANIIIKNKDYNLYASYKGYHKVTTLAGMPLKHNLRLPFESFVLEIFNERDYVPAASRNELVKKSAKQLNEQIIKDIMIEFGKIPPTLVKWLNNKKMYRNLESIYKKWNYNEVVSKYLPLHEKMINVMNVQLNMYLNDGMVKASLSTLFDIDYEFGNRAHLLKKAINILLDGGGECMNYATKSMRNTYFRDDDRGTKLLIIPKGTDNETRDSTAEDLIKIGVEKASIKVTAKVDKSTVVFHYVEDGKNRNDRINEDDIDDSYIKHDPSMGTMNNMLKKMGDIGIERLYLYNDDRGCGITVEQHVKKYMKVKIKTTHGNITGKDIIENPDKYVLLPNDHILVNQINKRMYKKVNETTKSPEILKIDANLASNLQFASMVKDENCMLRRIKQDEETLGKYSKHVYGIRTAGRYLKYMQHLVGLLDRIKSTEVKNNIIDTINNFGTEKIAISIRNSAMDSKNDAEIYVSILKDINVGDETNETYEASRLLTSCLTVIAATNKRAVANALKKYHFQNAESVSYNGDVLKIKMPIGETLSREEMDLMHRQTFLPMLFKEATTTGDHMIIAFQNRSNHL